ncbi:dormancy-associated protein 1-like isoform 2 precursor [Glycine max]|uniref:Uncharacterized protein n=1 Tax=Glycine max TaxID=3847 RepID=I1M216_SOYBN|nr:dormancy-associated protein 1-like isoform 2 precursor [Glycine max]|eukprot:XP_006593448.1 uncharacterized protein LOC100799417 isoform X1 [Glycine max]
MTLLLALNLSVALASSENSPPSKLCLIVDIVDEGDSSKLQKTLSMPSTPTIPMTPTTPTTPGSARKADNVWRSVFHPGSNSATKTIGAQMFDKPLPNTPTVYDWLYSGETRSRHR